MVPRTAPAGVSSVGGDCGDQKSPKPTGPSPGRRQLEGPESDWERRVAIDAPTRAGQPGDSRRQRRRLWLPLAIVGVGVVVVAAALAASRDGRDEPKLATPPTVVRAPDEITTPTTAPDASQVVADAYLEYVNEFERASEIPDPLWPGLKLTATGAELKEAFDQLQAWKVSGRVASYPGPVSRHRRPDVVSFDDTSAILRHCEVDDGQVKVASTGEVVNDQVVTLLLRVKMSVEDSRWKVAETTVEQRWEGVAGCAANGR